MCGPSGAGKTSLLRVIAGLPAPKGTRLTSWRWPVMRQCARRACQRGRRSAQP
uniref:hypothetical protein n=1 Tax=Thioclava sp. GXIMD4216 TaxID=3131929 RepID=UPI004040378A